MVEENNEVKNEIKTEENTTVKTEDKTEDKTEVKAEDTEVKTEVTENIKSEEELKKLKEEITNQDNIKKENEELKLLREQNDLLKSELAGVKNIVNDLVAQKNEVKTEIKPTRFENLSRDQQADMLVYGKTFVGEEGKRVPPEFIIEDDNGEVHYQFDEEEY